jgi:hypothetical protein
MTKEQALALLSHIQRETPRIQATFDESQARNGRGYQVKLHLAQREFSVNYEKEWESIKLAWQWFLMPEEEIEVPPLPGKPPPASRYLVDGIPMRIRQLKSGLKKDAWIGAYQEGGKTRVRYFGKQDPRPNYPLVPEEVPSGSA